MDTKGWFCAAASLESSVGSAAGWRARPVVFWAGAEKNNTDEPNRNQHFWDVFILFWVLIALAEVVGSVPHSCGHDSAFCFSDVEACTFFFIHKRKSQREEKLNMCSERRNSTQTISVWLNFHNITHSGMNKLWGPVPSSMAPLCRCHLRNNRNAHSLQPSLTPQAKAWTES